MRSTLVTDVLPPDNGVGPGLVIVLLGVAIAAAVILVVLARRRP